MNLIDYINDIPNRNALAMAVGYSPDYIYQVATGHRRASTALALLIEKNSPVKKETLRPDVWPPRKRS
jgi:DNA-binding transcriptional regulator YdaS (Cro superfamily)